MINPMTKMYISLLAIFFMFVCNLLILYSRRLTSGFVRFLLRTFSFLLLLVTLGMIMVVIFS